MKNSIKSQFKNICALAILIFTISTTKVEAQANCCNNDTIYFDNQVDCSICLKVECYDPNSGSTTPIPIIIYNDTPLAAKPVTCPNPCLNNFISCGGPVSPQTGKIILPPNFCELCPSLKISIISTWNTPLTPPIFVFTSNGQNSDVVNNSNCCSSSSTPNLEMSFDCSTKTLYLKCTQ